MNTVAFTATHSGSPPITLRGQIVGRPVSGRYRIALGLSAAALLLLPIAYIAVIIAVAWGIWLYAFGARVVFDIQGLGIWALLLYATPLASGMLLTLFLIKPLFVRSRPAVPALALSLQHEPELRSLIETICRQLGSPVPSRVEIDCEANAGVQLARGVLPLRERELVLRLGLPLVGALDAREFASVLAHEFAHFAQGTGLAATFLIRRVTGWFFRVVYERDRWDQVLARVVDHHGYGYAGAVAGVAAGFIWVGRKILHGLMLVGNAIAGVQLRQMEYDADYYSAAIAGHAAFCSTTVKLAALRHASVKASQSLSEFSQRGRLVDDFPAFVISHLAERHEDPAETAAATSKSSWFDTHPTDDARRAAVSQQALPGIVHGAAPATALFRDFGRLCLDATRHLYREELHLIYDEGSVTASAEAARSNASDAAAEAALLRLVGQTLDLTRPLFFSPIPVAPDGADTSLLLSQLRETRATIEATRSAAESKQAVYSSIQRHRTDKELALALLAARVPFRPGHFGLARRDREEALRDRRELDERRLTKCRELSEFDTALQRWVHLVGNVARQKDAESPAAFRLTALTEALAALRPWLAHGDVWLEQLAALNLLAACEAEHGRSAAFKAEKERRLQTALASVEEAKTSIGNAPHLFTAGPEQPIHDVLAQSLSHRDGHAQLSALVHMLHTHYVRILAEIALLGEQLEQTLAPEAGGLGNHAPPDNSPT